MEIKDHLLKLFKVQVQNEIQLCKFQNAQDVFVIFLKYKIIYSLKSKIT